MKAVILAAGEGKRLRPFTETLPKVMLTVANKPVLEYIVEAVKNCGITDIILVVGYKKEVIMEHFKDYPDAKITYVVQDKQLGTSHALLQAKDLIDDSFIVISGDNIIDQNSISKLIKDQSKYSMLIKEHPHPSKYGVVFIEKYKLKGIVEKPKEELGKFISIGIYKLPKSIFKTIQELASDGLYALSTVIQSVVDQGESVNTIIADSWMDIVYPWDLININEIMIHYNTSSLSGTIEKGVVIKGNVSVGEDTKIYSGCYIVGPVVIGEGCEIGPNSCIFPSTTVGHNSVVHPFAQVRNSVVMNDVHIGSNSIIKNSIIGRGSILGNNFSSREGTSIFEIEGEFKKIENVGVIVGEDCKIGSHVIVEPGKIIGRKCDIVSMKRIIEYIPSGSKVM
jgi:glucose-1-phosphate thymidylyltransferase